MRPGNDGAADDEDGFDEALRCFGLQIDSAQDSAEQEPPEVCEVLPRHVAALKLFMGCQGQWQLILGMSGARWRGAQAVNIRQVMDWQGVARKKQGALWEQYRVMETEALRIMNEREAQAARKAR